MLEGCVSVEAVKIEFDEPSGGSWRVPVEHLIFDEAQCPLTVKSSIGVLDDDRLCVGLYQRLHGRFILFRETQCAATGDERLPHRHASRRAADAHELTLTSRATRSSAGCSKCATRSRAMRRSITACARWFLTGTQRFLQFRNADESRRMTKVSDAAAGETGLASERFARALTQQRRRDAPSWRSIARPLPGELVESELFGRRARRIHRRPRSRAGRFERAERRHPVSRRDRRTAPVGPGQVAACCRRARSNASATIRRKIDVRLVAATT